MVRDNDIIKALGYVALHAAYLEEGIDVVMERLSIAREITARERRLPTSQKIAWCKSVINSLGSDELGPLLVLLDEAEALLAQRNEIIHGRIYAGNDRCEELRSGRAGIPNREVTADELYSLAETLSGLPAAVQWTNCFATLRAIERYISSK